MKETANVLRGSKSRCIAESWDDHRPKSGGLVVAIPAFAARLGRGDGSLVSAQCSTCRQPARHSA